MLAALSIVRIFLKNNWKIVVPILLVLLSAYAINTAINNVRKTAYANGISYQKEVYRKNVEAENKRNRDFENRLVNIIEAYGVKAVREASLRIEKETVYKTKLEKIILQNPTLYQGCKASQEALDYRNAIRAQGPSVTIELEDRP